MTAYRAETIGGLTAILQAAGVEASKLLGDGKIVVLDVRKGSRKRSIEQNRLQRLWLNEAAEQGDMTAEEYRGYCKLHFGVPILRAESEDFAAKYDRHIRPMPYETKMALMMEPFDFPVTRLMDTEQETRYLEKMYVHFTGLGFRLTEPEKRRGGK